MAARVCPPSAPSSEPGETPCRTKAHCARRIRSARDESPLELLTTASGALGTEAGWAAFGKGPGTDGRNTGGALVGSSVTSAGARAGFSLAVIFARGELEAETSFVGPSCVLAFPPFHQIHPNAMSPATPTNAMSACGNLFLVRPVRDCSSLGTQSSQALNRPSEFRFGWLGLSGLGG